MPEITVIKFFIQITHPYITHTNQTRSALPWHVGQILIKLENSFFFFLNENNRSVRATFPFGVLIGTDQPPKWWKVLLHHMAVETCLQGRRRAKKNQRGLSGNTINLASCDYSCGSANTGHEELWRDIHLDALSRVSCKRTHLCTTGF